jgi:hypothetical protein
MGQGNSGFFQNTYGSYPGSTTKESVEIKLNTYLLNKSHPRGKSKAEWFEQSLGFTQDNADKLSSQILFDHDKAVKIKDTKYGSQYNQVITIKGVNGKLIDVLFSWIKNLDGIVRLTTAIPTKKFKEKQ